MIEEAKSARLGPTFHRSFSLNRPAVSRVLDVLGSAGGIDRESALERVKERLREDTSLGTVYVDAMPRYAVGAGLLADKTNRLTPLGQTVLEHDPGLNHPATLWLMHYHLAAPQGPGPSFWHHLVTQVLHTGEQLKRSAIKEALESHLRQNGVVLKGKAPGTTVGIFTGTYTEHGLAGLQILKELPQDAKLKSADDDGKRFEVLEPDPPPTFALGYALAHFWEQEVNALRTNLSSLSAPGGFSSLFFLGSYTLNSALRDLQREGFVELEQVSPPHQLVRRWERKEAFLERLYD